MTEKPENPDSASSEASEISSNEAQSSPAKDCKAEDYKAGPGRPPRDTRWKKGCKSPNPNGRPRKDRSSAPDLKKALEQALNETVPVRRGDKTVFMTKGELGIQQLVNQYAAGDPRARRDLKDYAAELGVDLPAKHRQAIEEALAPDRQAILDSYVARRIAAGNVAPAAPVLAPPELLDDDGADVEAMGASPPTAVSEPEPEPEPKPGVNYPKPYSQMTWSEKRAWFPEHCAKMAAEEQEKAKAAEKAKAQDNQKQPAPKLDQASLGRGNPPPGGRSATTGKWT